MATTVHRQESATAVRKKHLLLTLLLSCYLTAAAAATPGTERSDADAIADLARSLTKPPPSWTAGGEAPCSFEGISCSSSGRVNAINLAGLGLAGTLPSSLTSLTNLESLQLSGNALSGAVPPLRIPTLTSLSLDGNAFTSLPKGFPRGLPALRHINIDNLPSLAPWPFPGDAIAGCPNLRTLSAINASLAGPIPAAAAATIVANLTWISTLRLSRNFLTGTVPAVLGKIPNLSEISLSGNFLQGPVPEFAAGVDADVVAGNGFCRDEPGPCDVKVSTLLQVAEGFGYPLSLAMSWKGNDPCYSWLGVVCYRSDVSTISLDGANLSGTISPAIVKLTGLQRLHLANNSLTGEIPDSLTTLPKLKLLDVRNNRLTGQLPKFKPSVVVLSDGNRFGESPSGPAPAAAVVVADRGWSSARGSADADASSGNVL